MSLPSNPVVPASTDPSWPEALASHSRFVQRIRRRYASELAEFARRWPGAPDAVSMAALVDHLQAQGRSLASALRVARQLVLERLVVLDVEGHAALAVVTGAMTHLAEVALDLALAQSWRDQAALHGQPLDEQGRVIDLWVVGMGKLGGRELNVSSDIDLIYVYEQDGQTSGLSDVSGIVRSRISAHEFFAQVVRGISTLIGDVTEDGFVFRVDLALRPHGQSGPSAVSLNMLEDYLLVHGREWERFAWMKSRIVAPRAAMQGGDRLDRAQALRAAVNPFVFRRYLDYGVFEALRQLHRKIRSEALRRAAGRPERANDVKLSRGGIREIEFIVQLLQVVRAGQYPEIRTRSTLKALKRLAARGLIEPATAQTLSNCYVLLRQIEHRIQYLDDQQTHVLPVRDDDLAWISASLGLGDGAPIPDASADLACQGRDLVTALGQVREFVANEFDALLHDGQSPGAAGCRGGKCPGGQHGVDSDEFLGTLSLGVATQVQQFARQLRVTVLPDAAKLRLAHLISRACQLAAAPPAAPGEQPLGDVAVLRFLDWITPLLRRDSYLSMLVERPEVLRRLLRLLSLAKWSMHHLMRHPGVIDELADPRLLDERFDPQAYQRELADRHRAWERAGQADEEALMDTLRRAHHGEVFRTLVRDVDGLLTVEQVADDLSALADATLEVALRWAWTFLQQKPGRQAVWAVGREPHFAVIAYGKLGGKELGYGSDLDVVFVYDDLRDAHRPDAPPTPRAGPDTASAIDAYIAFARKLIGWLTLRTSEGELFDIDTALRPNGNSGLLVSSMHAFDDYQRQRGSNTAWTWEHQALTRARWCAGDALLAEHFDRTRCAVLTTPRDPQALRTEVIAMRDRLRQAQPPSHASGGPFFDLKHSPGGMIDVEFSVQFLVLAFSGTHPGLLDNVGNIALLIRAEEAGLLPPTMGHRASQAYRAMRHRQHRARLDDVPARLPDAALLDLPELQAHRQSVLALWHHVFLLP